MKLFKKISCIVLLITIFSSNTSIVALDKQNNQDLVNKTDNNLNNITEEIEDKGNNNRFNLIRISGVNRYETALNVSNYLISKNKAQSSNLVLASGESYPDALSAGLLASEFGCPLLFIQKNNIPAYSKKLMDNTRDIYVVGGPSTISKNTFLKIPYAKRIYGENRLRTAIRVNYTIRDYRSEQDSSVHQYNDIGALYDGMNFPDALAATPYMYQYNKGRNLLLMLLPYINDDGDVNYKDIAPIVFGGENSVPKLGEELRIAGTDRYKTAVEIAKAYKTKLNKEIDTIVITSGESYPDALASTPMASQLNGAILLTESKTLNADTKEFIKSNPNIKNIIIVGGESSISSNVEKELKEIR